MGNNKVMPWTKDGDYVPPHMLTVTPETSLENILRQARELRIKVNLGTFKKEAHLLMDAFDRKEDCPPVPPLSQCLLQISRSVLAEMDRQTLAWICWQVAGASRGSIGFTDQGEMVFHLVIERPDHQDHLDMVTMDEVWIVLDPPKCLTNAYGG